MEVAIVLLCSLLSYVIGSIPFGFLVAKARGIDISTHGSGNIGATNVGRVLGPRFGFLVFILDFLKGACPVLLTGLVHVSSLNDDFYSFDPARRRLVGRQSKRRLAVGDILQVIVARIDNFKQQAAFAIVNERPAKPTRRGR